eukprot:TRINITY_DN3646_c0_g4_i3.p1 TRINITY_DN3646_c0_g4~~TRINITY_DN3646_c0_g4_i3.p1  ORF type:complete len:304 (+),score=87.95 TRINITY_DN3646_c0_g4_i3:75-986(+)
MTTKDNNAWVNVVKSLTAGGIAGAVSRTATSPLERLKVMQQVSFNNNSAYTSIWGALKKMYVEEGFLSYWKGNGTNVIRIAPYSALQFFSFDVYKRFFLQDNPTSTPRLLLCGALAGMTSSFCCYPLDLVRACLTVQTTSAQYSGVGDALSKIYASQGIRGLYRGINATLMGIAPYVAINFTTFDILKRKFLPNREHEHFDAINLCLGAIAGGTAATFTYPSDVIRRRMQLQDFGGIELPRYKGVADCARKIYKYEGIRGLYKGLTACYLKVMPSMAIAFMTYERLRTVLGFDPIKKGPAAGG